MASSLATAVYGVIAVWILSNSILESDDRKFGLAGCVVMVVVAAAWPLVFLSWPILAWSVSPKVDFVIPD